MLLVESLGCCLGIAMDRAGAVALLKQLLVSFEELQTRSFALTPTSDNGSQDYKVYIKDNLDPYTIEGIKELTQQNGLTLNKAQDKFIICKVQQELTD